MASSTPLAFSPTAILALLGKLRGADPTRPTPNFGWKDSVVDVVVPARNEERHIALCLNSLLEQEYPLRRITVIDDGSTDGTSAVVRRFQQLCRRPIELSVRRTPLGKTPNIREVCRQSDADALLVVDAGTLLSDRHYVSRVIEELFRNPGTASASGEVTPLGPGRRRAIILMDQRLRVLSAEFDLGIQRGGFLERTAYLYHSALYPFAQRFLDDGHSKLFGSRLHPSGAAVAYRTARLRECFDYAQPLPNSEEVFIGRFFAWKGWRNVHVGSVCCESLEPPVTQLPLRTLHCFPDLPLSLFRQVKRLFRRQGLPAEGERREVREPYRAPWGEAYTHRFGRPWGLLEACALLEKVCYPPALLGLAIFAPDSALLMIGGEAALASAGVFAVSRDGARARSAAMMLAATPLRVLSLGADLLAVLQQALDLARRRP